jgi:hypothetical protein
MTTNIIDQLASNNDFITRFKDDSKKAIQALIDTKQITADAHVVSSPELRYSVDRSTHPTLRLDIHRVAP